LVFFGAQCNSLLFGIITADLLQRLQAIQKVTARDWYIRSSELITRTIFYNNLTTATLATSQATRGMGYKLVVLTYKAIRELLQSYLADCQLVTTGHSQLTS